MPLYEYICQECGQEFEKMVRFADANQPPECPTCQSSNTHKRISIFASHGPGERGGGSHAAVSSSCGSSGRFT